MAKLIRLSDPSTTDWQTDWEKCCLCQEDKTENLKSPPTKPQLHQKEQDGYINLATNIPLFYEINALPIPLDPKRLDDGDGIESALRKHNAKYHQS